MEINSSQWRKKAVCWSVLTFVSNGQCAVEVLLLQGPWAVVHFVGDPTWALTVHLDGCENRNKSQSTIIVGLLFSLFIHLQIIFLICHKSQNVFVCLTNKILLDTCHVNWSWSCKQQNPPLTIVFSTDAGNTPPWESPFTLISFGAAVSLNTSEWIIQNWPNNYWPLAVLVFTLLWW